MRLAFYYENWEDGAINGTQHAVSLLCEKLTEHYDYECHFYNDFNIDKGASWHDVIVFLSSTGNVKLDKIKTSKVLWNHCWNFVDGMVDRLDEFDMVMGLSPKHAEHLGIKDWCYNGIDPKVFYRKMIPTLHYVPKKDNLVVYAGGPKWWKGGKKIAAIRAELEKNGFVVEELWGVTQEELADKFNEARFVLIPSEIESFCLVAVQAQACGCIPVAHDVGGISETIPNKELLYKEDVNILSVLNWILDSKLPLRKACYEKLCIENAKRFNIDAVANKFHLMMSYA
jgi:hypothetical protein